MANYTIELGTLVERGYKLALDSYPIFSEDYREALNEKIIQHFWFREIGLETPDRFNFFLRRKLNEIMPYYNQLYQSEAVSFNPLVTEYLRNEGYTDLDKMFETVYGRNGVSERIGSSRRARNEDTVSTNKRNTVNAGENNGTYSEQQNVDRTSDETIDKTGTRNESLNQTSTGDTLRTDNLKETSNEKTHADTLVTTDMNVTGDGTSKKGTDTTTKDVETTDDDKTHNQTVTNDLKEKTDDVLDTTQTVTNNLHTNVTSQSTGKTSSSGESWKDTVFSDLPQAPVKLDRSYVIDDGTENGKDVSGRTYPASYTIDGYATTDSVETGRTSGSGSTSDNGTSKTDNTGTVDTKGKSTDDKTVTNTGTVKTVGNETDDKTVTTDKTSNTSENGQTHSTEDTEGTVDTNVDATADKVVDNTGSQHTEEKGTVNNENVITTSEHQLGLTKERTVTDTHGNTRDNSKFNEQEDIGTSANQKTDEEQTDKNTVISRDDSKETSREDSTHRFNNVTSGRSRWSPSTLLTQFRDTFLNIDMMIIGELETLFMGVY